MDAHINNTDIPIHPGQKVKYHIDKLSISQKTLAKLISLSPSTLSEVLSGKRPVTTEYAMLFEAALGMNLDELLSMQTEYNKYIAGTDTRFRAKVTRIRTLTPFVTEDDR
ncbi:MAG: HigA family addiction module antitoxin [Bacteroidales bacterium]|nr:HigA family addiction module antitoxin [Bacteroidales bacterium]